MHDPFIAIKVELHLLFYLIDLSLSKQHGHDALVKVKVFLLFSDCIKQFLPVTLLVFLVVAQITLNCLVFSP